MRDPAWLAVDPRDSRNGDNSVPDGGLHAILRENSIGPKDLVHCVAGLVAERPGAAPSLLACLVKGLAARSRRQVSEVAREWFSRYLETVAAPVLWLYAEHGIALEAHQQNTLVVVNGGGWPIGGRYRDTRGCCVAAAHAVSVARQLPGAEPDGDLIVEDAVAGERLVRHLGVNNLMGLIGAFGSQGLADERVLLADLRSAFEGKAARGGRVPDVIHALLDRASLRCEATLLAQVSDPGELAEPLVTQSAYAEIPNPLVSARVR